MSSFSQDQKSESLAFVANVVRTLHLRVGCVGSGYESDLEFACLHCAHACEITVFARSFCLGDSQ